MTDSPSRPRSAAVWLGVLRRQFPELSKELAPSRGTALSPTGRRTRSAPGAAVRLFVSDTIRDITDGVIELEEAVCERLRLPRPPRGTVDQRLVRITALLDRAAADPVLDEHIRNEARRMAGRCSAALGEADPPVRVEGRCRHCGSVSLRVFPQRESVLCVNPGCRCSDAACGCRTDASHRHEWTRAEWRQATAAGAADETEGNA
ncbi:hypothetical protein [Streptomyces huiliensis]|uniref:hypothetical protein n=1 Tax=Streptomyces huiliensis TaxID=2876027 RepID=UPI001CBD7554|nr:hypothetical protein [Streptomyces huiliensis]MBZ4320602.1 hypothetical protein [Streptomyces huiliensis]